MLCLGFHIAGKKKLCFAKGEFSGHRPVVDFVKIALIRRENLKHRAFTQIKGKVGARINNGAALLIFRRADYFIVEQRFGNIFFRNFRKKQPFHCEFTENRRH